MAEGEPGIQPGTSPHSKSSLGRRGLSNMTEEEEALDLYKGDTDFRFRSIRRPVPLVSESLLKTLAF